MYPRASHRRTRAAAAALFLILVGSMPAAAVSPGITLTPTASPLEVTVSRPVAYVVELANDTNKTLKYATIVGQTSVPLQYLGALPATCDQAVASCDLAGLPGGASVQVTFYYLAPADPGTFTFTALANFDGQTTSPPANYQHAYSEPIETIVLAEDVDRVTGHSVTGFRTFSTGLHALGAGNRHGTSVTIPVNAEVRVEDLPAAHPLSACTGLIGDVATLACFGEASYLSIAGGAVIPGGFSVTMRWDASDLPKGVTEKKIQIVHVFDDRTYEIVDQLCVMAGGVPTSLPCLDGPPIRLDDKDIEATIWLLRNGSVRGWN